MEQIKHLSPAQWILIALLTVIALAIIGLVRIFTLNESFQGNTILGVVGFVSGDIHITTVNKGEVNTTE